MNCAVLSWSNSTAVTRVCDPRNARRISQITRQDQAKILLRTSIACWLRRKNEKRVCRLWKRGFLLIFLTCVARNVGTAEFMTELDKSIDQSKRSSDCYSSYYFKKRMSEPFLELCLKRGKWVRDMINFENCAYFFTHSIEHWGVLTCFVSYICGIIPKKKREGDSKSKSVGINTVGKCQKGRNACRNTAVNRRKSSCASYMFSWNFLSYSKVYRDLNDLYYTTNKYRNQKGGNMNVHLHVGGDKGSRAIIAKIWQNATPGRLYSCTNWI